MSAQLHRPSPHPSVIEAVSTFLDGVPGGIHLIVAFSGGLDSCVLLHALRFGALARDGSTPNVSGAHFDHAMRAGSRADAAWSTGVCRAWGVPVVSEASSTRLTSEADARSARYAFLDRIRSAAGPDAVMLTAHHADDQAETVLFRALRGTGLDGLRGISRRRGGLVRPLLDVWRKDLEAYAAEVGLCWREDPTNEHLGYARNALRREIIPGIERDVVPGARKALVRLAQLADADAQAWAQVLPLVVATLDLADRAPVDPAHEPRLDVARASLLSLARPLRSRVIRYLVADLDIALDAATVLRIQDFLESSISGRVLELGGGATVRLELERVGFAVKSGEPSTPETREVVIESDSEGCRQAVLAGRTVRVAWSVGEEAVQASDATASFDSTAIAMPLKLRARAPGDRIRLRGGSRKVKKVLLEHRIPFATRDTLPVLVDAEGEVLWIPRVVRSTVARPRPGVPSLNVRIEP